MPYKDAVKRKEYAKQHNAARYSRDKQQEIDRVRNRKELFRRILQEIKEETPCADCGEFYPYYVMDLDHLPNSDKTVNPSKLHDSGSITKFLSEINKCEVVCANCHRQRTYDRSLLV